MEALFDQQGNYLHHVAYHETSLDYIVDDAIDMLVHSMEPQNSILSFEHQVFKKEIDLEKLHPYFCWQPNNIIKCTFELTTQYAHTPVSQVLPKYLNLLSLPLMFVDGMRLLPLTLFFQIHLPLMMVQPWHRFLLAHNLWLQMCTP